MTIWFDDLGYFQATKLTIPRSTSFQFCTLWIAVPKQIEHDRTVISHDIFSMILLFYLFELFFSTPLRESLVVFDLLHQENAPSQLTFINETHPPILPPVRDGDSDSTTTPGTDMEIGETGPWVMFNGWFSLIFYLQWCSLRYPTGKLTGHFFLLYTVHGCTLWIHEKIYVLSHWVWT